MKVVAESLYNVQAPVQ